MDIAIARQIATVNQQIGVDGTHLRLDGSPALVDGRPKAKRARRAHVAVVNVQEGPICFLLHHRFLPLHFCNDSRATLSVRERHAVRPCRVMKLSF